MPTLRDLVRAGHEILLVITQPDRPAGRGLRTTASAVKVAATELSLPLFQPDRISDPEALDRIRQLGADLHVVVAYGQILRPALLAIPPMGTLNVHASLLPRHRGAAPIAWAILAGDTETGVSIMQMDAGVDTGPVLAQQATVLDQKETARSLEPRLAESGAALLVRTIEALQQGSITPTPQPAQGATYARRLSSEDGKLDQNAMSALQIDRHVRALTPQPGCWITVDGADIKVLAGHLAEGPVGEGYAVPTSDGTYILDQVQLAGGRPMSAAAWARGKR